MFVWCLCGDKVDDHDSTPGKHPCKVCGCPYLTFRHTRDLYEDWNDTASSAQEAADHRHEFEQDSE